MNQAYKVKLMLLSMAALSMGTAFSAKAEIHMAVFSSDQLFWSRSEKAGEQTRRDENGISVGIIPFLIKEYAESIPCDSCHRLSGNGFEFFLENYLRDMSRKMLSESQAASSAIPTIPVSLIAPHMELLKSAKLDLLPYLDSLVFPTDKWFDGYSEKLIYRPSDRLTGISVRNKLDRLGGALGLTHLLIPFDVKVRVFPVRSNDHQGGLEYGFHLVFWNVQRGQPEWALAYREKISSTDLDKSLKGNLDSYLFKRLAKVPRDLDELMKSEPR